MEKLVVTLVRYGLPLLVAAFAGCRSLGPVALDDDQQAELTAYMGTYDSCIVETAAGLEDGETAISRIAGMAAAYCRPEARDLLAFLDSTPLSQADKARYLDDLARMVAGRSAALLQGMRKHQNRRGLTV